MDAYLIALPFIALGGVSSYLNYKIQKQWYKDYLKDVKGN